MARAISQNEIMIITDSILFLTLIYRTLFLHEGLLPVTR